jgi:Na+/H+-dicarboxylate symporter
LLGANSTIVWLYIYPMKNFAAPWLELIEKRLWAKVLFAIALGLVVGFMLQTFEPLFDKDIFNAVANLLSLPGKIFIKLVQMVMVALIVSSIISGITGSNLEELKTIGLRSVLYFVGTTIFSVSIAGLVTWWLQPGKYMQADAVSGAENGSLPVMSNVEATKFNLDFIVNLIPSNPLQAMLTGDMLSLVIFSVIIGIAILQLKRDQANTVIRFTDALQQICLQVVNFAMKIVPVAVFGIMVSLIVTTGKSSFMGIGVYVGAVVLSLALVILLYLSILTFYVKQNPFQFLSNSVDSLLIAFSTTSSAAAMPVSIKISEEKMAINPKVSKIIIPLGATINMDGTAVYQCVSFLFIIQAYDIPLSLSMIGLSMFTIVMASIGTPAVPGAGMIVLASVLQNAGIPAESILLIVGIERILGMLRAPVNVLGDLTACQFFNKQFQ